jgi:hypothetical protein
MSISLFLSYSHKNRHIAGELKSGLEHFGLEAFLAHEDLSPSSNWLRTIRKKLRACDVFVPLLTKEFTKSEWTDQETGFAVGLKKIIFPIKIDVLPYGFITEVHAQKMPKRMNAGACWRIIKQLHKYDSLRDAIVEAYIPICAESDSFANAASHFEYLMELGPFSTDQLKSIFEMTIKNRQIHESYGAQRVIEAFVRKQRGEIPKALLSRYRKKSGN